MACALGGPVVIPATSSAQDLRSAFVLPLPVDTDESVNLLMDSCDSDIDGALVHAGIGAVLGGALAFLGDCGEINCTGIVLAGAGVGFLVGLAVDSGDCNSAMSDERSVYTPWSMGNL